MAITSNLYPPIIQDTIPAFIRTKPCRIYFALSTYNTISDIKNVQVSLINQKTNASALKTSLYPSGIKITNLFYDSEAKGEYNYYIQIEPNDLQNGSFDLNQFYKVQLRFTAVAASTPPSNGTELATWLYNNMQYFSEWSRICLLKGIEQPQLSIRGFDTTGENQEIILTNSTINIIGELIYPNNQKQNEYLKSYNIKIYQNQHPDNILFNSGEIYTNIYNPNELNYDIPYELSNGVSYTMSLTYTTNNLYTQTIDYDFTILEYGHNELKATITATTDEENGRIRINIVSTNPEERFIGNITIRRTSSESDFHNWEDVNTIAYAAGTQLNYSWYDSTIKSGVWYKYCAQRRNAKGDRGTIIQIEEPIICRFEDIFLTRKDKQLKIRFNPTLTSFKYNVTESQQLAIGAKYPYIKRNAANYFRTFSLGGLISSLIDMTDWYDPHFYDSKFHDDENEIGAFITKKQMYGEAVKTLYQNFNQTNNIYDYNDYIYERDFREKVYDFLYKNEVILFRSETEGNILIKLMDINFEPVETLGRRLYSFSATAVEIDEATTSNYDKYNIQSLGNYESYIMYEHTKIGQVSGTYTASDGNVLNSKLSNKHQKSSNKGYINQIKGLNNLKLEIESDPYVIIEQNGELVKATTSSQINAANAISGYIVVINNKEMIIRSTQQRRSKITEDNEFTTELVHVGQFELKEPNTLITDLRFKYPTTASLTYTVVLQQTEDTSHLVDRIYYYNKPGQLYGVFKSNDSLVQKIYNKYLVNYQKYYQRLLDISEVEMQGPPGTIVYVKDSKDSDFNRHILQNGYLRLKDDEVTIQDLYFYGVHLSKEVTSLNDKKELKNDEFMYCTDVEYDFPEDILNPIKNGVYKISYPSVRNIISFGNDLLTVNPNSVLRDSYQNYNLILQQDLEETKNYIYYNNNWYPFTSNHDVICPTEGLVNYICEVVKEVY